MSGLLDIGFVIDDWIYLENGIMVVSGVAGLVYCPANTIDGVTLISRRAAPA